ncbi:MAG: DNA translocase FtsK 4TM domain-containing protein [Parcubacteria group bacterium]|jgi:S-DNA-T family DNA segregation ATPase FtsK/SpoIIIE
MGRKKKKKTKNEEIENGNGNGRKKKSRVKTETKRSIIAVMLIALAILAIFSLFGGAGTFGAYFNKTLAYAFGIGRFLLPFLMVVVGFMYFRRDTESYYIFVAAGFVLFFASVLGIIHIFYPLDKMVSIASSGQGGGFLGVAAAYPAMRLFGFWAGLVVLVAIALAALLLALNVPLRALLKPVEWMKEREEDEDEPQSKVEQGEIKIVEPLKSQQEPEAESRLRALANRITREKFAEEPVVQRKKPKIIPGWGPFPLDLLEKTTGKAKGGDLKNNAQIIQKTLQNFGIEVEIGDVLVGPTVSQYSFKPAAGVKLSKITGLQNDLSLALAKHPIRIEAPIPGKSLIGIEVPNDVPAIVRLRDILESPEFLGRESDLSLALGRDVSGNVVVANLEKMPHLMIAGSTGTGKSVAINSILVNLLYQNSPRVLKLILVDPKRVELTAYNGIPHLLTPTVVENGKVANALKWAIGEMERRYKLLQESGSRDITSYNIKVQEGKIKQKIDDETGEIIEEEPEYLPFIVIIIDELADIMAVHSKEVEAAIVRLAQMARAVGIHLIVSTQRPSVEVLTGLIKANITTRIAFKVATQIDSRTILDMAGADKLLGNGDLLYLSSSSPKPKRIQGVLVSESEVKRVVKHIVGNYKEEVEYNDEITQPQKGSLFAGHGSSGGEGGDGDDFYEEAKDTVIKAGKASASLLQRRLRVGYARAARLLDLLEADGTIGPADGSKPREILVAGANSSPEGISYEDEIDDQKTRDRWQA